MSDLISRKAVIDLISKYQQGSGQLFGEYHDGRIDTLRDLKRDIIHDISTAYDVDKVVEKLSEAVYTIRDTYGLNDDCTEDYIAELCETVKGGGQGE